LHQHIHFGTGEGLQGAAAAATKGAESTKEMVALAGRSNYVNVEVLPQPF